MSFAEHTGRTKTVACCVCGTPVTHEEIRQFSAPRDRFRWSAVEHRAPCGAHCAGGGYEHGETDVHIPAFGRCPRCGAIETEVAKVIEKPDRSERVVILRYTPEYHRDLGFRIELEVSAGDGWSVKSRWPTNYPDSLDRTVEWAKNYVGWLKDVD
jgi:hypothetical protein